MKNSPQSLRRNGLTPPERSEAGGACSPVMAPPAPSLSARKHKALFDLIQKKRQSRCARDRKDAAALERTLLELCAGKRVRVQAVMR